MDVNRKGDLAEIKAVAWFWEQGYEVFRNQGCTGAYDLVVEKDGKLLGIDVKSTRPYVTNLGEIQMYTKSSKEAVVLHHYMGHFDWNADNLLQYIPETEMQRLEVIVDDRERTIKEKLDNTFL